MKKILFEKLKTLRLYFVISRFLDWLLIKLIRIRWKKLYKHVQNNQIGTPEYSKRRRNYENLIIEVEKNDL
jgi:hypothetical protein